MTPTPMVVIVPHVPVHQAPPSPEAQELGTKIAELVRILRRENPKISGGDVRVALSLAERELRPEIGGNPAAKWLLLVALLVGMAILGIFVATYQSQSTGSPYSMKWIIIGIGALGAVLGLVALLRKRA